jgi:hypothetical protein
MQSSHCSDQNPFFIGQIFRLNPQRTVIDWFDVIYTGVLLASFWAMGYMLVTAVSIVRAWIVVVAIAMITFPQMVLALIHDNSARVGDWVTG